MGTAIFKPLLPEGFTLSADGIISGPGGEARVLLHCCCAPCSSAILEWMAGRGLRPGIFFSNSNIVPLREYALRRETLREYALSFGMEVIDDEYDHDAWLEDVRCAEAVAGKPLAEIPERGARCLECFRSRLSRAAGYASANGYGLLTTTLASSRWKVLSQVDQAGREACAHVSGNVIWWGENWRKGGLQDRRNCIIRDSGMYNQNYCGCEFSKRD